MGGKVNGTFRDENRQMYDCQLVGQTFDAEPGSEKDKRASL